MNVEDAKELNKPVVSDDETVTFKVSERMIYGVLNYDATELMAAITGYGLKVSFNLRYINSLSDAESCANAFADVFYQALLEELLSKKPQLTNNQEG